MSRDLGLLLLRVSAGAMMMNHGIGKVSGLLSGNFHTPDPLGIGPFPSQVLAAFAEFFCALLVVVGFRTRLSLLPVIATMVVAALVFHLHDPWNEKELPVLYAVVFVSLLFTGGGRYTLDRWLAGRAGKKGKAGGR